jgi:quercetin dioxygenase-like cupin family protein
MKAVFPPPVLRLPQADVPIEGVKAYLSQAENHQVIFMSFSKRVEVAEHSHESQWGIVLEGRIDLTIGGEKRTYEKGDRYYIPKGVKHSATIYPGYCDVTYFNQADRYRPKKKR